MLKGKVVVVTGASAGIGAAVAELAARQGAAVVLVARREAVLAEVLERIDPANALTVVADVTLRADVERAAQAAIARFGHIDVWLNNAGRGMTRTVSALTEDDLDEMMRINVKSVLYGMQAVLPHFRARGSGHIINVSSMLGRLPLAPMRAAYAAAKAAVNALTANLRVELKTTHPGIHVSAVHPGVVATEFGIHAMHGGPDSRHLPGAQAVEEVAAVITELIANPRADVYTRPGRRQMVAEYFAAEDMAAVEASPPFGPPLR